jgi:hypothetical protein
MVGRIDNAFTPGYLNGYFEKLGKSRKVEKGVTAVRLLIPAFDLNCAVQELARAAKNYCLTSIKSGVQPVRGMVDIKPQRQVEGSITTFYVDGRTVYTTSDSSIAYGWDTTNSADGFHEIVIESASNSGRQVTQRRFVLIMHK